MPNRTSRRLSAATRNQARLVDAGRRMTGTALAAREMAAAAGKVIGYRTALMAEALGDPVAMTNPEFTLMGSEKVEAATESAFAMADGIRALADAWNLWMATQARAAFGAAADLAACRTPLDLVTLQQRYVESVLTGSMASGSRLAVGTARLIDAGLVPLHRTAMANARRLAAERKSGSSL
ncbi:MAG TPA: phasin family protein [Azospirillaceae bacterium]|nr:phasin family protein [Azospirillaceae bacterium]